MARLLTIFTLILALLLFPPAALALISNNAVPGDATYPIKRGLEDVIFSIASVHPVTKAWFSAARSDRRFQEFNILVTSGKQSDATLNELVEQTQSTANQIVQISDQNQKAQLAEKLSESIKKYDKGLAELPPQATVTPTSSPQVISPTSKPVVQPTSVPEAAGPPAAPRPTAIPHLTSIPQPSPTSTPTLIPPQPPSSCDEISDPIQRARCKLQDIQVGLGAASQHEDTVPPPVQMQERLEIEIKDQQKDKGKSDYKKYKKPSDKHSKSQKEEKGSDKDDKRQDNQDNDDEEEDKDKESSKKEK